MTAETVTFALENPKRTIQVQLVNKKFRFRFRTGKEAWTKLTLTEDAAWAVSQGISALHPNVSHSGDPLWRQVREARKARERKLVEQ